MIDLDDIAIARLPADEADAARRGGEDRGADRAAEVEASVQCTRAGEGIAAIAKSRRHHQHVGGVARRHRDERALEHFHAEQRAVERRSEEHTSELQSLMRISYAVFCLKKQNK